MVLKLNSFSLVNFLICLELQTSWIGKTVHAFPTLNLTSVPPSVLTSLSTYGFFVLSVC